MSVGNCRFPFDGCDLTKIGDLDLNAESNRVVECWSTDVAD
jgi:hypothetical protein